MAQEFDSWVHIKKKRTLIPKIHAPMYIAALFIIAKIWKQFKQPLTAEWMKEYSITCMYEYKSVIKKEK